MVTRALLLTFDAVAVAAVDNAHTPSPLATCVNSDILRRVRRVNPLRVFGCHSVPDAHRVVQT
jgi:hypothetical protein